MLYFFAEIAERFGGVKILTNLRKEFYQEEKGFFFEKLEKLKIYYEKEFKNLMFQKFPDQFK